MTFAAMVVFGVSIALILVLFALKRVEMGREQRFGEGLRARADVGALRVKSVLAMGESYLADMPFFLGALSRYFVHVGALSFARLARASAKRAHQLADFVSHKRGFERRETKSQFLRDVSEVKNGKSDDGGVATM